MKKRRKVPITKRGRWNKEGSDEGKIKRKQRKNT